MLTREESPNVNFILRYVNSDPGHPHIKLMQACFMLCMTLLDLQVTSSALSLNFTGTTLGLSEVRDRCLDTVVSATDKTWWHHPIYIYQQVA
jgi:hypothetical protein